MRAGVETGRGRSPLTRQALDGQADPPPIRSDRLYGDMELLSAASQHQPGPGDAVTGTRVLSKEDFVKLVLPDSPLVEEGRRKVGGFWGASKFLEALQQSPKGLRSRVLPSASSVVTRPAAPCTAGVFSVCCQQARRAREGRGRGLPGRPQVLAPAAVRSGASCR